MEKEMSNLNIIVSTYNQYDELQILLLSILNQSHQIWKVQIIHDGQNRLARDLCSRIINRDNNIKEKISYSEIIYRKDDYGHSARVVGLEVCKARTEDYILFTNGDNYYCPIFVEEMMKATEKENVGVVYCDMVHSHNREDSSSKSNYGFFDTKFEPCKCDIGAFIVRFDIAKAVGFNHRHNEADAEFIKEILEYQKSHPFNIEKVNKVLFVHN